MVNQEPLDLVVRAHRVATAAGESAAGIGVRDGSIVCVEPYDAALDAVEVIELSADEVLLPGLVDSHVHINDPGRSEWEGFASATRAAAAGGVTTVLDMPLNSIPPTVDVDALEVKQAAAATRCHVDVGFWGGAVPGNISALRPLHTAGVFGFKCFLVHSGVDEFPPLDASEFDAALAELRTFDALMIVHAEDAQVIAAAPEPGGRTYRRFLDSRPPAAEERAIAQVIALAKKTGCRVHILHLSNASALGMIAAARRDGVRITVETCPHYLVFSAEEIVDGATQFKCCPPIRDERNRELLWQGLEAGAIDAIVSDHSPSTADLKALDTGDFGRAWGGISSLQLGLPVIWTEARRRGFALPDVVRWMSRGPARVAGLERKGDIAVGFDADFCVFAPDEEFIVRARELHHKNAVTPYHAERLSGVVRRTVLRGAVIDDTAGPVRGRLLRRGAS
ncbi:allantoinase AllB [Nocardia sp. NPDC003963]